jgi:hypothetical protein
LNDYNNKVLQEMLSVQRGMLRLVAKMNVEHAFLVAYLLAKDYLTNEELKQMDLAVAEKMEPTASALEDADAERLLDFLRKFEGPVQ